MINLIKQTKETHRKGWRQCCKTMHMVLASSIGLYGNVELESGVGLWIHYRILIFALILCLSYWVKVENTPFCLWQKVAGVDNENSTNNLCYCFQLRQSHLHVRDLSVKKWSMLIIHWFVLICCKDFKVCIPRTWCKTIETTLFYITSYHNFAPSPRYMF